MAAPKAAPKAASDPNGTAALDAAAAERALLSWAQQTASENAECEPCEEYVGRLETSVRARLKSFLQRARADGGTGMVGELDGQQALPVKKGKDGLQSFKE